jgi:hypothetical protein
MNESAITITLPDDVAAELHRIAREDGVSPERKLALLATQSLRATQSAREFFEYRAKTADWAAYERVFGTQREGGEPPREGDRLDEGAE